MTNGREYPWIEEEERPQTPKSIRGYVVGFTEDGVVTSGMTSEESARVASASQYARKKGH